MWKEGDNFEKIIRPTLQDEHVIIEKNIFFEKRGGGEILK